jgi:NADH-quinone oxidoreductase E subunit
VNLLQTKYPAEIAQILSKYPPDFPRSAVMPLLYLAQRETGFLNRQAIQDVAEITGLSTTEVGSIIGFYTLYHDKPGGRYRLQVCTDLACALRGADQFLEKLCENLGVRVGETTADGLLTVEEVTCLAGCDRAPLFQVQTGDDIAYHEHQTVESALETIEKLRQSEREKEVSG